MDLGQISNSELELRLVRLAANERAATAEVVMHMAECERRRAFAEWGYSSLFDYATRGLGYSRAAAMRRIKAARCIADFPQVGRMMQENKCSLSAIQMFADVISVKNADALLEAVAGQSEPEVEVIAARYGRAAPTVSETIKPVAVSLPLGIAQVGAEKAGAENSEEPTWFRGGTTCKIDRNCDTAQSVEMQHQIQFCANERFMAKLERVRNLAKSGSSKAPTLAATFERALDEYLKRHCPAERQKRRVKLQAKRHKAKLAATDRRDAKRKDEIQFLREQGELEAKGEKISAEKQQQKADWLIKSQREQLVECHNDDKGWIRFCPQPLRDQVLERDGYQCSYVSKSGLRCSCRWGLELDHIVPVGKGGRSVAENLRVLCRTHNLLAAEESYGRDFIEQFRNGNGSAVK